MKIIVNSILNADHDDESKKIMDLAHGWVSFISPEQEFIDSVGMVIKN